MPRTFTPPATFAHPFQQIIVTTMARRGMDSIDVEIGAGGSPKRRLVNVHRNGAPLGRLPVPAVMEGYARALDLPLDLLYKAAYASIPGAVPVPEASLDPTVSQILSDLEPLSPAQRKKVLRVLRAEIARLR